MKLKHASLFAVPGRGEILSPRRAALSHATSHRVLAKAPLRSNEPSPTNFSAFSGSLLDRSTSLNRLNAKPSGAAIPQETPGCTCVGKGLRQPNKLLATGTQAQIEGLLRGKLATMHKTATNWNKSREPGRVDYAQVGRQLLQNGFGATQTGFMHAGPAAECRLPLTENRASLPTMENADAQERKNYVKGASTFRKSRAAVAGINTSSKSPSKFHVDQKDSQKNVPAEQPKPGVRTFVWEGIHFEVSPKKNLPSPANPALAPGMQIAYSKEMNLMDYDFNNSISRNRSESPKEEKPRVERKRSSMNFGTKDPNRTLSTTANTNSEDHKGKSRPVAEKRGSVEEETGTDDSTCDNNKAARSPKGPELPKHFVRAQAKGGQASDRVQSPPTPAANTISMKLRSVIFQHKPVEGEELAACGNEILHNKSGSYMRWMKYRDKMVDLKSQIQEDIDELSSEDEQ